MELRALSRGQQLLSVLDLQAAPGAGDFWGQAGSELHEEQKHQRGRAGTQRHLSEIQGHNSHFREGFAPLPFEV